MSRHAKVYTLAWPAPVYKFADALPAGGQVRFSRSPDCVVITLDFALDRTHSDCDAHPLVFLQFVCVCVCVCFYVNVFRVM